MNVLRIFRYTAILEALSYLVLLGFAMPMKYIWGNPIPVKIAGMAHGVLFIAFCVLLAASMMRAKWSLKTGILIFLSSLVPIVPFFVDKWLVKEEKRVASEG